MILEYKLDRVHLPSGLGNTTPGFVANPGHFYDEATKTYVGFTPSAANRPYKVPDSVVRLTVAELKLRVLAIHATKPYKKNVMADGVGMAMTHAEVEQLVDDVVSANDLA